MRDRLRFRLRAGQDIRFRRGSRSVLHGRLRGCQCAAAGQAVGNGGVIEGNLIRQVKAVLGIPAGMVGGVQHPLAAAGLVLGVGAAARLFHHGLVVCEQQHVAPFPQQRGYLLRGLHGPAVVVAHGVGLLKLGDGGMSQHHHVVPGIQHFFQRVQQLAEFLLDVGVTLAVAKILNAVDFRFGAHGLNAQPFSPVGGVDDQRAAGDISLAHLGYLVQQHGPAGGLGQALDVQPLGAALGVDEHGVREMGGKGALADALRAVQHGLDRGGLHTGSNCILAHLKRSFRPAFGLGLFGDGRRGDVGILHHAVLDDDLALAAGGNTGGDGLQTFGFQPGGELLQGGHVHLLELVQQNEAAVRVQAAHNGSGYPQLVAAGHVPPVLSFISKGTVLDAQAPQRQVCAVQQSHAVGTFLLDGFGQTVVLAGILGGFVLGAGFFEVGADLAVGVLDIPDGRFQLGGGFVLKLGSRFPGLKYLLFKVSKFRLRLLVFLFQIFNFFIEITQGEIQLILFINELVQLVALALVLAVAGQNVLLLTDEVGRADRLVRGFRVGDELIGKVLFLGGQLTGEGALVVQALDLQIPGVQLGPDADDAQQDVGLFLVAGVHEAGQVQRQRFHKGVEQLLTAAPPGGVGDGQAGVLALALHHNAVGELHFQMRRGYRTVPLCGVRAETVAAESPRQRVQNAGLALIVVAAHNSEPGGRRGERNGLDALDVFGFQSRDFYRHVDTSP
nr:MAG TPA: hypothetical protein [Caudoviricetes sp.]